MKQINRLLFMFLTVLVLLGISKLNIVATEQSPIYYEDEVLEVNDLPGGVKHTKLKGYSQVTNPDLIAAGATEAGYGSSIPLVMNKYYSQQLNILEIPNEAKTKLVPWGVVKNGLWSLATVELMAKDYEESNPGWKVVAAINGDFFDINGNNNLRYTPSGSMMVDGDLYKVNTGWPMLGINNSGEGSKLIGKLAGTVSQSKTPYLYIYDENDNIIKEFAIDVINTEPGENQTAAHFAMYNSNHSLVPQNVTNGYVVEKANDTVPFSKNSLFGKGVISEIGNYSLASNQFAVSTNNLEVEKYLDKGVKIRVQYKILSDELNKCENIIGYHDNVIVDGVPCYENDGYGNARLPRTLLGTRADGSIVMIVVDGRQAKAGYYGICSEETGAIVSHYGMVNGYQMDGGGSATMVILKDGKLQFVNSPSDSGGQTARSDSDCILIAMQVPTIEYDVVCSDTELEFNVNVIELIEDYKDLYIDVDGKKKKIEGEKVVFNELNSFTEYVYKFYALVDNEYVSIVYQGTATTLKQTPEVVNLIIDINDTEDKYEISFNVIDPDDAITYAVLEVGGKKYWLSEGVFSYQLDKENLGTADDWSLIVNYNLQGNTGMKKMEINNCDILFDQPNSSLDAIIDAINNNILKIFTN